MTPEGELILEDMVKRQKTTCSTCNNSGVGDPRDWHHYRHAYKGPWKPASSPESPETPAVGTPLRAPFDPVLRLALIRKGVITPDDLKAAEAEIMVTSQAFGESMGGARGDLPGRTASSFGQ